MFRTLGKAAATELEGVELATPDVVYDQQHTLDLGNRKVELRATGQAHTKCDQVVKLPNEDILFTGDLVEANQFAIFPWFPPHDTDVSGTRWLMLSKHPDWTGQDWIEKGANCLYTEHP